MSNGQDTLKVRLDVGLAMRAAVIDHTGFDKDTYHEGIVPSKEPMDGFEANMSAWSGILGVVEGRLEATDPKYSVFDTTDTFVRRTRTAPLRDTNNAITKIIIDSWASLEAYPGHTDVNA
jgi:hypothetical protein